MSKDATLAMQPTFICILQIYYIQVTPVTKITLHRNNTDGLLKQRAPSIFSSDSQ